MESSNRKSPSSRSPTEESTQAHSSHRKGSRSRSHGPYETNRSARSSHRSQSKSRPSESDRYASHHSRGSYREDRDWSQQVSTPPEPKDDRKLEHVHILRGDIIPTGLRMSKCPTC